MTTSKSPTRGSNAIGSNAIAPNAIAPNAIAPNTFAPNTIAPNTIGSTNVITSPNTINSNPPYKRGAPPSPLDGKRRRASKNGGNGRSAESTRSEPTVSKRNQARVAPDAKLSAKTGENIGAPASKVGDGKRPALRVHTVLSPCEGEHIPFDWSVNPYRGCAFACRYCYARYTHEWLGEDPDEGFDQRIFLKQDIDRVLARDLARLRSRRRRNSERPVRPPRLQDDYYPHLVPRDNPTGSSGEADSTDEYGARERIAIGTATDPYQPIEHKYGLTRACLQVFAREPAAHPHGYDLSITTKSDLVIRDIPLLQELGKHNAVTVNVTLTTLDAELARGIECGAPTPQARLRTLATLVAEGIDVCAFVSPILPGITDSAESLEALFEQLGKVGVRRVVCEALFLRSPTKEVFMSFLRDRFPELLADYERRYSSSQYSSPLYVERLRARVERLRDRFGLLGRRASHDEALADALAGEFGPARTKQLPKGSLPRRDGLQQLYLFD